MAVGEDPPVSVDVDVDEDVEIPAPNVSADNTSVSGTDVDGAAWEPATAAKETHSHVNDEREAAGRGELEWRSDVATAARAYAEKLAAADTLTHTLDGTEPESRYYADGISAYSGENINQMWWQERMTTPHEITYIDSPADLGQFAVSSWMDSDGHRENILRVTNGAEGIGIAKNETGAVYAVQVFTR
jgi:uncharacterized protein YkwD